MAMDASILITSYKRAHLLKWGLFSLARQDMSPYNVEIVVLNDGLQDETDEICNSYKNKLNIRYVFTGKRNSDNQTHWRVPGYAFNIGANMVTGEFLVLSCAEIFHLDNSVKTIIAQMKKQKQIFCIPDGKDDTTGAILKKVEETNGIVTMNEYNSMPTALNVRLPFFMGITRRDFMNIGGYDEDFTGMAWDDDDITNRLHCYGYEFSYVNGHIIHLYHPRINYDENKDRIEYNKRLYLSRGGKIMRNSSREWGVL